ncbi:Las1-domain-containing protein [Leucogyrophana mollusca]|uniref:Las1-domain-containing protein n=1 Tax=Leucogyrophana mollusca TaxID=85980 RepID=A0ACB8BVC7_9AGAM|nr:Las1-domain-containing protein [Leucogyrophana mollusca]
MRLPRRIPWSHIGELDQLCSWIFADEHDIEAKELAVSRLSAWRAITSLPHALESTLAILSVQLIDASSYRETQGRSLTSLSLRQSYATAIIRMVNGLVDPLQVGAYARSIASIAAQLGLPSWLVELRHAATHEDLPSLGLLREASRESLSWLLHNYFLPTINPSSVSAPESVPLRSVIPLLKQYKALLKRVTRDASLRSRYKVDIDSTMRDIERWIAEARVSVGAAVHGYGSDNYVGSGDEQEDIQERWALHKLCDALMEKGSLVPLSKKKRNFPTDSFLPPNNSLALWTPLLSHLQSYHPSFPSTLTTHIVTCLVSEHRVPDVTSDVIPPESDISSSDPSYDMCLARWVAWIIQTWDRDQTDNEPTLRKDVVLMLANALAPGSIEGLININTLTSLLETVTAGFTGLQKASELLLSAKGVIPLRRWNDDALAEMSERLDALMSHEIAPLEITPSPIDVPSVPAQTVSQADGWKLLDSNTFWKPCPIGIFIPSTSAL